MFFNWEWCTSLWYQFSGERGSRQLAVNLRPAHYSSKLRAAQGYIVRLCALCVTHLYSSLKSPKWQSQCNEQWKRKSGEEIGKPWALGVREWDTTMEGPEEDILPVSWAWWHPSTIPVLGRLKQKDFKWEGSLGSVVRSCLKNGKKKKMKKYFISPNWNLNWWQ